MIKCKKGKAVMRGTTPTILAEYMTITKAMVRTFPTELEIVLKQEKENLEETFKEIISKITKENNNENEAVTDPELS